MNYKDLMPEDLVYYNGFPCRIYAIVGPYPREDKSFDNKPMIDLWVGDGFLTVHEDEISPIRITPEILEKNELPQYQWIKIYLQGEYGNITDFSKEIKYVHQLQQILRLCGLNDLASNFKV